MGRPAAGAPGGLRPRVLGGSVTGVRIVFGSDEQTEVTDGASAHLRSQGHEVLEVAVGEPWPEVGRQVGMAVASGRAERGVVCCWTGTGVSIAANKVPGVRAALCTDAVTAVGARRYNDANVLAVGLRLTSAPVLAEMLDAFLATEVDDTEVALVDMVEAGDAMAALRAGR